MSKTLQAIVNTNRIFKITVAQAKEILATEVNEYHIIFSRLSHHTNVEKLTIKAVKTGK